MKIFIDSANLTEIKEANGLGVINSKGANKMKRLAQQPQPEKMPEREPIPQPSDRKPPEREPIPVPPDAERPVPIKEPPTKQPPIEDGPKGPKKIVG